MTSEIGTALINPNFMLTEPVSEGLLHGPAARKGQMLIPVPHTGTVAIGTKPT